MILADTSAWVEFDRATGSAVDRRLAELIADGAPVVVTEPVVAELVAGATTDDREVRRRRMLGAFPLVSVTPADFDGAARVHRTCRRAGVTPRGLLDCVIAAVAIRTEAALLARDRDITQIAAVMSLRLDQASPE